MIVVITGASSGIGKELFDLYKGHTVIGISRNIEGENCFKCDVSNSMEVENVFMEIGKRFGSIDLLINNAGFGVSGATELIPEENANKIFDVNFFGVLNCSKYALPFMKKGSRIVNISSACALFPLPFRALYCASKAAVSQLSLSMRMELSPAGIDVVSICPGDTKTNFTKNREKHFETNSRYQNRVKNSTEKIDKNNDKRMSAVIVSKKIFKICNKKKTKPEYIIGAKYKLLHFATKIFPQKALIRATTKIYGGKN